MICLKKKETTFLYIFVLFAVRVKEWRHIYISQGSIDLTCLVSDFAPSLNSAHLSFVCFLQWSKAAHQTQWHHNERRFPPCGLFCSRIQFLIHAVIFRLDWKLHCWVLTAAEWTHWKTFESSSSAERCRRVLWNHPSENRRANCKHFTHPIQWNIYQSHFPGLDKLMFWQQIKQKR